MFRFLYFIKQVYFVIMFIVLEFFAFNYYRKSSIYTNARIMTTTNHFVGGMQSVIYDVKTFFMLRSENDRLNAEIAELNNKLNDIIVDSTYIGGSDFMDDTLNKYWYMPARVVNNSFVKQNNFITVDKGKNDGVEKDMSIIFNNCVVGYILDCTNNYSVGISMLNTKFKTSGRNLANTYTGSINWNGNDIKEVLMTEVPKYADIAVGDTIVTTSFSSKFPENVNIGVVKSFKLINATYHNAVIEVFTDFSTLQNVQIVKFKDYKEKTDLERKFEPVTNH